MKLYQHVLFWMEAGQRRGMVTCKPIAQAKLLASSVLRMNANVQGIDVYSCDALGKPCKPLVRVQRDGEYEIEVSHDA